MTSKLFINDSGWYKEAGLTLRRVTCPIQKFAFHAQKLRNPDLRVDATTYMMQSLLTNSETFSLHTVEKNEGEERLGWGNMIVDVDHKTNTEARILQTRVCIICDQGMLRAFGEFFASFRSDGSHSISLYLQKNSVDSDQPQFGRQQECSFIVSDCILNK